MILKAVQLRLSDCFPLKGEMLYPGFSCYPGS